MNLRVGIKLLIRNRPINKTTKQLLKNIKISMNKIHKNDFKNYYRKSLTF